tara:strand:+ start:6566 stop:7144 length:579 start_codon:yes stop_codon:yes gene_type:complete
MEDYLIMPSDCSQDRFVVDTLNQHKNGFWVELGCQGPIQSSNTHILEVDHGWRGLSIDISQPHINLWEGVRSTEHLVCADALALDYTKLFEDHNVPEVVDYLSVDLEPPPITFTALKKIPFDKYKFKTITFEHDHYRQEYLHYNLREDSRKFFESIGYYKLPDAFLNEYHTNLPISEDWYVHPELVDVSMFK